MSKHDDYMTTVFNAVGKPERTAAEQRAADVALLRQEAKEAADDAAIWSKSAEDMDEHGHHAAAEADRDEARILKRVMQALHHAADRIEAGDQ